jgi:Smg protein
MDDRLADLLSMLRERFAADANVEEVEAFLSYEGYDRRQIGEILSLLFAEIPIRATGGQSVVHNHMTFRVMGPHERGRFAPEAWGHLLSLSGAGILNAAELEHVIERALIQIDGRIALDDLRALMEGSGYDPSGPSSDHATVH